MINITHDMLRRILAAEEATDGRQRLLLMSPPTTCLGDTLTVRLSWMCVLHGGLR